MAKKIIQVRLRNYEGLKDQFTQVANSMHDYIEDTYVFSVYFYLCRVYNRYYHYAFPSIRNIAKRCHISETKAKESIKWLTEKEFIEKKQIRHKDGFKNNTYVIRYLDMDDVMEELIKTDETKYVEIEIDVDDCIENAI